MSRQHPSQVIPIGEEQVPGHSAPTVQRIRIPDQIAQHLMRRIIERDLPPGTLLPTETELVREFSVGKSAIREAVRIVSTKGLVEVVQGSGMRVAPRQRWNLIDPELISMVGGNVVSIVDLMELRLALEPSIAAHAATRATPDQLDQLAALVEKSAAHPDDSEGIVERDMEFHNLLAEAADNPLYSIVLGSVAELQVGLRRKLVRTKLGRDHGITFHSHIVEAVRNRDPERARQQMTEHLKSVAEDLRLAIEGR
jgi:DNA-binding FadR family transcriptional regulator